MRAHHVARVHADFVPQRGVRAAARVLVWDDREIPVDHFFESRSVLDVAKDRHATESPVEDVVGAWEITVARVAVGHESIQASGALCFKTQKQNFRADSATAL
jgi:hypothetical protein